MEQIKAKKMFTCPQCGPVETAFIHGEWINANLKDVVFELIRPDWEEYEAKVAERSVANLDPLSAPRILASVEEYAVETRKFQCNTCGKVFTIPAKQAKIDPNQVAGGTATLAGGPTNSVPTAWMPPAINVGSNRNTIWSLFDSKFSEFELDDILLDCGDDPNNYGSKSDKIDAILDRLY